MLRAWLHIEWGIKYSINVVNVKKLFGAKFLGFLLS